MKRVACDVLSLDKSRSVMQGKRVGRGYAGNERALSIQHSASSRTEPGGELACGSDEDFRFGLDPKTSSSATFSSCLMARGIRTPESHPRLAQHRRELGAPAFSEKRL
jgi:hypothetical protein